jgi:hypothetical protein
MMLEVARPPETICLPTSKMVEVAEPPVKTVWEPLWMWVDDAEPLEKTCCTPPLYSWVALA